MFQYGVEPGDVIPISSNRSTKIGPTNKGGLPQDKKIDKPKILFSCSVLTHFQSRLPLG